MKFFPDPFDLTAETNNKSIPPSETLSPSEAIRYDSAKTDYALLPLTAIEEVTQVLQWATKKYPPNNWRKGMAWSRCFNSALRHLFAWWKGEDKDPETGLSHLAHCACNILFLIEYQTHKNGHDDRFSTTGF